MITTAITTYDDLPITLSADDIATVLGISRGSAYALLHSADFPTSFVGSRLVVSRANFLAWLRAHTRVVENCNG